MTQTAAGILTSRAASASVAVALLLAIAKLWAVGRTGSAAMLGSLADTSLDLIVSIVTLMAVRLSAQPADRNHRFGHGKAEALAALFQIAVISVAAALIIVQSAQRLGSGAVTTEPEAGIAISVLAMAVTLLLIAYQRRVIARTGSVAITTDSMHYQSDLMLNASVIAALLLDGMAGLRGADALFGILIGLWLGYGAWRAANDAIGQLMDAEWPLDRREALLAIAARHPAVRGVHDMRTRTSGTQDFAQFHIWVDPAMTIAQVHHVMDEIEADLRHAFPNTDILIHPDPAGHVDHDNPLASTDAGTLIAGELAERRT